MKLKSFVWSGKCKTLRVLLCAMLGLELETYEARFPQYYLNNIA